MAFKQTRGFDPSKGGSRAGYCLANVRMGYSIAPLYNDAWQAWNNTVQHRNSSFPANVDIPLFYDYTDSRGNRYGHINVRMRDGRIWNDGRFFQSMATFQNSMRNVRYVGWGETLNNVRVVQRVQGGTNVADRTTLSTARILAEKVLGRGRTHVHAGKVDSDLNKHHVNVPLTNGYIMGLWNSGEAKNAATVRQRHADFYNTYVSKINELSARPTKAQLESLGKALKDEQAKVEAAEKALEQAKKTGGGISAEDSDAIRETNNIIKQVWDLLTGVFKR
jgi:hypothetical protein